MQVNSVCTCNNNSYARAERKIKRAKVANVMSATASMALVGGLALMGYKKVCASESYSQKAVNFFNNTIGKLFKGSAHNVLTNNAKIGALFAGVAAAGMGTIKMKEAYNNGRLDEMKNQMRCGAVLRSSGGGAN